MKYNLVISGYGLTHNTLAVFDTYIEAVSCRNSYLYDENKFIDEISFVKFNDENYQMFHYMILIVK